MKRPDWLRPALLGSALLLVLASNPALGQSGDNGVQSGPMIGHVSMRSAQLWIQTNHEAEVQVRYTAAGSDGEVTTPVCRTHQESAFTAHVNLDGLEPGTKYNVEFIIDGEPLAESVEVTTQVLWDYRMDPPAFKFVTGSCAYINEEAYDRPGRPYGGGYEIFESMAAFQVAT